jgi:hypothetical protein
VGVKVVFDPFDGVTVVAPVLVAAEEAVILLLLLGLKPVIDKEPRKTIQTLARMPTYLAATGTDEWTQGDGC